MSGVYESLKVIVQDTLQRGKTNSVPLARVKRSRALTLNDELEDLDRLLAHRIGKLKTGVKEGEALVAREAQNAEQLIESLRAHIAALEPKLRETEDTVRRAESGRQKMEETLTAKILDLQDNLKKKEELLGGRDAEINDLKANIDRQVKQLVELELAVEKAKGEAASQAKRAEDQTESSKAKIGALEARLKDTEKVVRQNESTIKELEQNLAAKTEDLESQLRSKEELVARQKAEINDLKSQLKSLTKGIGQVSSFFRQAEALAAVEDRGVSTEILNEPLNGAEERPATCQSKLPEVTPIVSNAPREIVSPDVFHHITGVLSEITKVMGPIASIIVRDHVMALGEDIEKFPKTRLPELLESLSEEMSDESLKTDFRERLAQNAQIVRSILTP